MRFGIVLTAGDPRLAADLAAEAEAAGWDGVFTYDAIAIGDTVMYDPWILLAAVAMRTERVTIGAIVFAPPRRRPWKLAREAVSLDVLSNGRLVLPVGLGTTDDLGLGNVGEPAGARERAERLDETLAILDGLESGEPFAFDGAHYRFGPMTFQPRPVQRPRIPVWVVGAWPHERSMRRAVRWDGIVVQALGDGGGSRGAARDRRMAPPRAPSRAPRPAVRGRRRRRDPGRRPRSGRRDRAGPRERRGDVVDRGRLGCRNDRRASGQDRGRAAALATSTACRSTRT